MLTATHTDLKPFEDLAASFAAKELAKKTEEHDTYPFGPFFTKVLDKAYEVGFAYSGGRMHLKTFKEVTHAAP